MPTRIPGYSEYYFDDNLVLKANTCECFHGYEDDNGYRMVCVWNDFGISEVVGLHRLLALAFIPIPPGIAQPIPNHKDGNKSNNRLDNLEWTTYGGNMIHAYQTGLRDENQCIQLVNVATEEISTFYSMNECSRFFGVGPSSILFQLRKERPVPYRGYLVRYG